MPCIRGQNAFKEIGTKVVFAFVIDDEMNISFERRAGECRAGTQIREFSDTHIGFESALDFARIGSRTLAQAREFVDKRNRRCEKRIERVFRHFGRLDRHDLDARRQWSEDFTQERFIARRTNADNVTIGIAHVRDRFTEPQIFGAYRKADMFLRCDFFHARFEDCGRSDWHL